MDKTILTPSAQKILPGISILTCCMNRAENLDKALPTWIEAEGVDEIIIVDWSSTEPVKEKVVQKYNDPRIVVARVENQSRWILSHAFNLAARLTTRTQILKLDSDVKIKPDFFKFNELELGIFLTGNWRIATDENEKHLNGIIYAYREDFFRVNGYNEYIKTYGWDDTDLYDRLQKIGLKKCDLLLEKLHHMEHGGRMFHQNSLFPSDVLKEDAYVQFETNKNLFITEKIPLWSPEMDMIDFSVKQEDKTTLICHQVTESKYAISPELVNEAEHYALGAGLSANSPPCDAFIPWELTNKLSKHLLIKLYTFYNYQEVRNKQLSKNPQIYSLLVDIAWGFYQEGFDNKMEEYLHKSLKYSTLSSVKIISDWLDIFCHLSATENRTFDEYALVNLPQWNNLIYKTLFENFFPLQESKNKSEKSYQIHLQKLEPEKYNDPPKVTIITSLFKGDKYIKHFLEDITRQTIFDRCELIIVNGNSPGNEDQAIIPYLMRYPNIFYKRLDYDPGLYEIWNLGAIVGRGEYITNANIDDRRAPQHIEKHVQALDENPDVDVVAAPLKVTIKDNETWENNTAYDVWFVNFPDYFEAKDLFVEEYVDGRRTGKLISHNLAHCMPVWRKSLHEKNGYFDEATYGTSCDWEFWLRCGVNGSKFMLLKEPLGLYLENPTSHNRRFANKQALENKIIEKYCEPLNNNQVVTPHHYITPQLYNKNLVFGIDNKPIQENKGIEQVKEDFNNINFALPLHGNIAVSSTQDKYPRKINLAPALSNHYGNHRSGWAYALSCLEELHNDRGVLVDGFIEKKFAWGHDPGDRHNNPQPYRQPWIGFLHNPPNMPHWFQYEQAPQSIFASELWKESIKYCQGIFCLSKYQQNWLQEHLDVPVVSLMHPTQTPEVQFFVEKFLANPDKKVVQIGWWLRKLHSIYYLPVADKLKKAIVKLNEPHIDRMFALEQQEYGLKLDDECVEAINYLLPGEYDSLLSENIVYLELYDSGANNVIIECMVRNTPILVNPLPAVKEYLGEDYPFYYSVRGEAAYKAQDLDLIQKTYNYLLNLSWKDRLTAEYFLGKPS